MGSNPRSEVVLSRTLIGPKLASAGAVTVKDVEEAEVTAALVAPK